MEDRKSSLFMAALAMVAVASYAYAQQKPSTADTETGSAQVASVLSSPAPSAPSAPSAPTAGAYQGPIPTPAPSSPLAADAGSSASSAQPSDASAASAPSTSPAAPTAATGSNADLTPMQITVGQDSTEADDATPVMVDGHLMVPMQGLSNQTDADIYRNRDSNSVGVTLPDGQSFNLSPAGQTLNSDGSWTSWGEFGGDR